MIRAVLSVLLAWSAILLTGCAASRSTASEANAELVAQTSEADTSAINSSSSVHTISASELLATLSGLHLSLEADSILLPSGVRIIAPRLKLAADSASTHATANSEATARDTAAAMASHHRADSVAGNSHSGTTTDSTATAPDLPAWMDWIVRAVAHFLLLLVAAIVIRRIISKIKDT